MNVVPAGVHHRHIDPLDILHDPGARIGGSGLFFDRQGIEVRAHKDNGASAIFQNADQTMSADLLRDFEPGTAQFLRDASRRLFLVQREFRMSVQLLVERDE